MLRRLLILTSLLALTATATAACGGAAGLPHPVRGIHQHRVAAGTNVFPLHRGAGCSGVVVTGGCTGAPKGCAGGAGTTYWPATPGWKAIPKK